MTESFSDFRLFVTIMLFSIIQLSVNAGCGFVVVPFLEKRRSGKQRGTSRSGLKVGHLFERTNELVHCLNKI